MRSDKHAASHCPTSAMGGLYINKSPGSGWGGVRSSTRTEIPAESVGQHNPEAERSARAGTGMEKEDVAAGTTLFPTNSGLYDILVKPNGQGEA